MFYLNMLLIYDVSGLLWMHHILGCSFVLPDVNRIRLCSWHMFDVLWMVISWKFSFLISWCIEQIYSIFDIFRVIILCYFCSFCFLNHDYTAVADICKWTLTFQTGTNWAVESRDICCFWACISVSWWHSFNHSFVEYSFLHLF